MHAGLGLPSSYISLCSHAISLFAEYSQDGGTCLTVSPDLASKTSNALRSISEALMRISRGLHEHTQKLERAVEGTYAKEGGDPRIRLLSDSLHLSRLADLELGRLSQSLQRVLQLLQGQCCLLYT